jgi:simple sugar transport system permease protein
MTEQQVVGFLAATITFTSPILIVALGELVGERSGVFNLGVEGIMLTGALVGVFMTGVLGNPWLGLVAAMVVGVLMAFVHAYLTVSLKSDQIISGLMITIFAGGMTTFIDVTYEFPNIDGFDRLQVPLVEAVPILGDTIQRVYPTDVMALLLVPVVWYLFKTDLGLRIISVGDNPGAADSMGISVRNTRYFSVLVGGAMAALGGAVMSVASVGFFGAGLTSGRGFVAIGVVVFAAWRPLWVLPGAVLFGAFDAAGTRGESIRAFIDFLPLPGQLTDVLNTLTHPQLMNMYPFLVTVLALLLMARWGSEKETTYPQAIMQPFYRESE